MKRVFCALSVALLAVSCWQGHSGRFKVDIDKALKKQVDVRKLYAEATVIPLHCPVGKTLGQDGKVVLEVAADRFFLLDRNEILVFDGAGSYVTSITSEESIIDFSVYISGPGPGRPDIQGHQRIRHKGRLRFEDLSYPGQ